MVEPTYSEKASFEKNNNMEMWWEVRRVSNSMHDTDINGGIYFFDFNYSKVQNDPWLGLFPYSYHIPYGSKEAKIKYKILYPNVTIGEEIYNVKFNLVWPDL
jgi:hypothetical protein